MLCLDISGSMETQDLLPSRVEAAKATLKTFVDNVPGDRIGLVVFAGKAFVQCPLTLDHDVIKEFIDRVDLTTVGVDGTAIGDGLLLAVSRLMQDQGNGGPPPSRLIVLATDGQNNAGKIQPRRVPCSRSLRVRVRVSTPVIAGIPSPWSQPPSERVAAWWL